MTESDRYGSVPVITLTIDHMKHSIVHAMSEYQARVDKDVQAAIEQFCEQGNIARVVREEVARCIESVMREEVKAFFGYGGPGRKVIREAVYTKLSQDFSDDIDAPF